MMRKKNLHIINSKRVKVSKVTANIEEVTHPTHRDFAFSVQKTHVSIPDSSKNRNAANSIQTLQQLSPKHTM